MTTKEKKVTIRMTEREYTELEEQAKAENLSVTALCRLKAISGGAEVLEDRKNVQSAIQIRRLLSQCSLDSRTRKEVGKELDSLCHI